jgi:hypothetical protein
MESCVQIKEIIAEIHPEATALPDKKWNSVNAT